MEEARKASGWSSVRKRSLAATVLVALVVVIGGVRWKLSTVAPSKDTTVAIGRPLPAFLVKDAAQKAVDLRTVKPGTRRVVAFYSPACEVCKQEMPSLMPFPENLELIMVNEDHTGAHDPYVGRTTSRFSDPDETFKRAFKYPSLPTFLFIDEKGVVVDGLVGSHAPDVAKTRLAAFARARS